MAGTPASDTTRLARPLHRPAHPASRVAGARDTPVSDPDSAGSIRATELEREAMVGLASGDETWVFYRAGRRSIPERAHKTTPRRDGFGGV